MKILVFYFFLLSTFIVSGSKTNIFDSTNLDSKILVHINSEDFEEYSFFLKEFKVGFSSQLIDGKNYFLINHTSVEIFKSYIFSNFTTGDAIQEYRFTDQYCSSNESVINSYISDFLSKEQPFMIYSKKKSQSIKLLCFNYSNKYKL